MKRRDFLQALGLSAGSLSLRSIAKANPNPNIKRFVVFYTQHGTCYDGWKMRPSSYSNDMRWSSSLLNMPCSPALSPLIPYFDRSIVLDGLGLVSAEADQTGLQHEKGQVHSLTGSNIRLASGVPLGTAASIDQKIAQSIALPNQFPSLELAVGDVMSVCYNENKHLLPVETSPLALYRRMFGAGNNAGSQSIALQKKTLEQAEQRFSSISTRLSQEDSQKLDIHRDLLRDISVRMEGLESLRSTCSMTSVEPMATGRYVDDVEDFIQLITAAFSCDMTRVVSLNLGTLPTELVTGLPGDVHDEYAHEVMTDPVAKEVMTEYTRVHAMQLARLLDALDAITDPHGDGVQSILDNTVVLWAGELGDGAHGLDRWPAMLIGGGGCTQLKLGQYVHFPNTTRVDCWSADVGIKPTMGLPHQHVLNSILQQFDPWAEHMGEKEIKGSDDQLIDCTGVIPEILS